VPPRLLPPQQQRSRDSYERLLVAGLELLESDGLEGFTIAAVAKRAGVGTGLVYRRFADKNALLGALFLRSSQRNFEYELPRIRALAAADLELDEFVLGLTKVVEEVFRLRQKVIRAFITANRGDATLAATVKQGILPLSQELEKTLLSRRAEFGHPDPDLATSFALQQMFNAYTALVTRTNRVHPELGWDTVTEQLSSMTVAYLNPAMK
jgi:AcrR family transcriptional regulator